MELNDAHTAGRESPTGDDSADMLPEGVGGGGDRVSEKLKQNV